MNRTTLNYILLIVITLFFTGCAILPFNKKVRVINTDISKTYLQADNVLMNDGSPKKSLRWIVFSDRDNNSTQVSVGNDMPEKKLLFLEPLYVLKSSGNFLKVTGFDANFNLKNTKGKLDKKTLKFTGWINKEKLLLWSGALKEKSTFFTIRAITNVTNSLMVAKAVKYFYNDSLLLFSAPDLLKPISKKIGIGKLVFIYKISEDKKSYLIGADPFITTDSIAQSMYGWISVHSISIWGSGAAFTFSKLTSDTTGLFASEIKAINKDSLPLLANNVLADRNSFENIFPIQPSIKNGDSIIKTGFLENILDYSKNKVFNVLGKPIYYNKYREIIRATNKLNIVFVIDGGATNRLYLPSVKSVLQDLQLYFDTTTFFKSARFGTVFYKNTKCADDSIADIQQLTANYGDIIKFIDEKQQLSTCNDEGIYQPLNRGILGACNLLSAVKNETNIIVIVGTTGNDNEELNKTVTAITKVQARLMYFQTISKSADAYNDFVLAAEKTVIASSENISILKKDKLVDQNDVLPNTNYSLQTGEMGIYYLDYPSKSMTEGFVLYPKKGAAMLPGILKRNFDSLLHQVIADNQKLSSSLHTYFKSNIGVNNTFIKREFSSYLSGVPLPIPTNFASAFINIENGFFIPAYTSTIKDTVTSSAINYGVLLTEAEYDKQSLYFNRIFNLSGAANNNFRKNKAIKRYVGFIKDYTKLHAGKLSRSQIFAMSPKNTLQLFTGFTTQDSLSNSMNLRALKKQKIITNKMMLNYFNGFKYYARAMGEKKNDPSVRINCNGTYYYWFDEKILLKY